MKSPSWQQEFAAEVRAAAEAYEKRFRKPCGGGWSVPGRETVYKYLCDKFNLKASEVSYFFTYARSCTHKWSEGACNRCPIPVCLEDVLDD